MDAFNYFQTAHARGLKPTLLEFTHPVKQSPLVICGIRPKTILEVRDDKLFKDNVEVGAPVDIFHYLGLEKSPYFFPSFLGYFAYDFAKYLGKPSKISRDFPAAYFALYEEGLVLDNDEIIHESPLDDMREVGTKSFHAKEISLPLTEGDFCSVVANIKDRIRRGDVYQVNLSLPFSFKVYDDDIFKIYRAMRLNNKSPFMGVMCMDDAWILSGSPERLFAFNDDEIITRPIAGTKKRGDSDEEENDIVLELQNCPKENAEHAMLVDLLRNDLNQIASPGSVFVEEDRSVEFYSHVMHLVSSVKAKTKVNLEHIFRAIFPGGTITGAPKINVMKAIDELEDEARGPYTGALGYISSGFGVDFNILIRSVFVKGERAWIRAGAGIVIDSDEHNEWQEIHRKAMAIKDVVEHKMRAKKARATIVGLPVVKPQSLANFRHCSIAFVENHDSFSFNIIEALKILGARVHITSALTKADLFGHTHVVIGPGPGNPEQLPSLMSALTHFLNTELPILGICLGHQALGHFFGASIRKLLKPIHGQCHDIHHTGEGLFHRLPSPARFTRYHSLAVAQAPRDFVIDAYSEDDIMAIRHKTRPIYGVQFHPESYLSENGLVLLEKFLTL